MPTPSQIGVVAFCCFRLSRITAPRSGFRIGKVTIASELPTPLSSLSHHPLYIYDKSNDTPLVRPPVISGVSSQKKSRRRSRTAKTLKADERQYVLVLVKDNYVVSGSIGARSNAMMPTNIYVDTCSGVNIVNRQFLPPACDDLLEPVVEDPNLGDANGRPLQFSSMIRLSLRLGNRSYRIPFFVADRFAVDVLLGTSFHDNYIKSIECMDSKIILAGGEEIPILKTNRPATAVPPDGKSSKPDEPIKSKAKPSTNGLKTTHPIRVAEGMLVPPQSQVQVTVTSEGAGLVYLSPKQSLFFRQNVRMSNGIAEVRPGETFQVLVANFGKKPARLHKGTIVGFADRHPLAIVTPSRQMAEPIAKVLNLTSFEASTAENSDETVTDMTDEIPNQEDDWRKQVDLSHLTDADLRRRVIDLLDKYSSMWDGTLGTIKATEHRIDLEDGTQPIRSLPYRQGPQTRKLTMDQIQKQLDAGVIEPCTSEWASPVVFASKKDGSMRFCVDYRRLNMKTKADAYPLPRMDDCIDSLGDAAVFSTLDCNSGYWQIPMAEKDMDKTAFVTHLGTFRYKRMPFGLRNAPATFQRALDIILSGVRWQVCLVYIDDVIVFSKDVESHFVHLDQIMTLLRDAGITLKLKKCEFFKDRVTYLGHVVSPGKLSVADENKTPFATLSFRRI